MKKIGKIITIFLYSILALFICCFIYTFICLYNTPWRTIDHYDFIIVNNELVEANYNVFINVPEEYSALEQIDYDLRMRVAQYMKENDLVLSDGKQEFLRISGIDVNELISDFEFFEK